MMCFYYNNLLESCCKRIPIQSWIKLSTIYPLRDNDPWQLSYFSVILGFHFFQCLFAVSLLFFVFVFMYLDSSFSNQKHILVFLFSFVFFFLSFYFILLLDFTIIIIIIIIAINKVTTLHNSVTSSYYAVLR